VLTRVARGAGVAYNRLMVEPSPTILPPPPAPSSAPADRGRVRIPAIDAARGVALIAMAVYHFTWDLGYFGFIRLQAGIDPAWRLFAKCIAGTFLILVGVGLVLAAREGLRRGPYLRRLGMIAAGAAAISLATWWAMPQGFVYFGILHCIAVSSVLALPFLRAPVWAAALGAAVCLALPLLLPDGVFDQSWLLWLGLATRIIPSNDYEPLLPWFGMVLAGVALGRLGLRAGLATQLARWRGEGPAGRGLRALGRHSLAFYLVHQPVLFGSLWLVASLAPGLTSPPETARPDPIPGCRMACEDRGAAPETCSRLCFCMVTRLAGTGLADKPETAITEADRSRITGVAQACQAEAIGTPKAP
jgi:uncharacterized membrane protein